MDLRCNYCNWLMKEVSGNFVCSNCGKKNVVKEEKESIKKEIKLSKEVK